MHPYGSRGLRSFAWSHQAWPLPLSVINIFAEHEFAVPSSLTHDQIASVLADFNVAERDTVTEGEFVKW